MSPRVSSFLVRASGIPPLALALLLYDPYLLPVRSWVPAALAGLGLIVTVWLAVRWIDPIALMIWVVVPVVPLGEELQQQLWRQAILRQGEKTAELGQHFVIGYSHLNDVIYLSDTGAIGGIFVDRYEPTLKEDIDALQATRRHRGLPPLLVATDQEGGIVSRLSPPLTSRPSLAALSPEAAKLYGEDQGRELASLGVTVNFAPVVDLKRDRLRWDRNSFIAKRAISSDPEIVSDVASAYAEGLRHAGVMPTAKHFPGLGRAKGDTHHFRVRLIASATEMEASDWRPFRRILAGGPAFLMAGHAILDAIDPYNPASSSREVIDGLIRRRWGFDGVVVTDDLTMPSFFHHGFCTGVVEALNAGADLLLISYDHDQYYRAFNCALDALNQGKLDRQMLDASNRRLARSRTER